MTQLVPTAFDVLTSGTAAQVDANFNYVSGKWLSVKDAAFGATGNGTTNDYTAISAAITYAQSLGAGTVVYFPPGTYAINTPISITGTPVRLVGTGRTVGIFGLFPAISSTSIKYTGVATASPVIGFSQIQNAGGVENLEINANSLADIGLQIDTVCFCVFRHLLIDGAAKRGIISKATSSLGSTTSWNTFEDVQVNATGASVICAIWLTGDATANTCHNTFRDIVINYGGAANGNGINLGNSDNNRFYNTYMNRTGGGTGAGVNVLDGELAGFPVDTFFYHLQAGAGGWVQQATQTQWNSIYGYARDNGQPAPVVPTGSKLFYIDGYGAANTLIGGIAGAAGGADTRTPLSAQNAAANAQIIIGYQNTSANFFDAAQHSFRDGTGATKVTINSNIIGVTAGGAYQVNSVTVVGARNTGWTAMTGLTDKATAFDPTTVTLNQLAQRVSALQAALTAHGLIGT